MKYVHTSYTRLGGRLSVQWPALTVLVYHKDGGNLGQKLSTVKEPHIICPLKGQTTQSLPGEAPGTLCNLA